MNAPERIPVIVEGSCEKLEGTRRDRVCMFKGTPFATGRRWHAQESAATWTAFAHGGAPKAQGLDPWPRWTKDAPQAVEIGVPRERDGSCRPRLGPPCQTGWRALVL
jgi:carboxylesterase type B